MGIRHDGVTIGNVGAVPTDSVPSVTEFTGVRTVANAVERAQHRAECEVTRRDPAALTAAVVRVRGLGPTDPKSVACFTWPVVADQWRHLIAEFSPSATPARP